MGYIIEKMGSLRAIRKRTRGSVKEEHARYNLKLFCEAGMIAHAQYRRVPNENKWNAVKCDIFPALRERAEIVGGKAELSADKEKLTAEIRYRAELLDLKNDEILDLFLFAESMTVAAEGGEIVLTLRYDLYDREPVADHSERLKALRACLCASGNAELDVNETAPRIDAEPEMM